MPSVSSWTKAIAKFEMEIVSVYIDFKSPYSYVAVKPLVELSCSEKVALEWLPFALQLKRPGANGEAEVMYPLHKIRYMYTDVRRFANAQGLTIKGPERIFDGTISGIGMLFAQRHGFFEAYRDTVFERFFKRDLNIDSNEEISSLIRSLGGDSLNFAEFLAGKGPSLHSAIQARATELGVFGVPTMVYRGDLFWGGDRLEFLRARIRQA
jgi:2-hydroxychromene-2-carboxylate isomerase